MFLRDLGLFKNEFMFADTFDNYLRLSITDLKKLGYLKPFSSLGGSINWSRNGNNFASLHIHSETLFNPHIQLSFSYQGTPINERINLLTVPSNLGKGNLFYFECPSTKKKCRVLYCVGGYFVSRLATKGIIYESQTEAKNKRPMLKLLKGIRDSDNAIEQIYKPYFKTHYNGKPTKRYLKLSAIIEREFSANEIEQAFSKAF